MINRKHIFMSYYSRQSYIIICFHVKEVLFSCDICKCTQLVCLHISLVHFFPCIPLMQCQSRMNRVSRLQLKPLGICVLCSSEGLQVSLIRQAESLPCIRAASIKPNSSLPKTSKPTELQLFVEKQLQLSQDL